MYLRIFQTTTSQLNRRVFIFLIIEPFNLFEDLVSSWEGRLRRNSYIATEDWMHLFCRTAVGRLVRSGQRLIGSRILVVNTVASDVISMCCAKRFPFFSARRVVRCHSSNISSNPFTGLLTLATLLTITTLSTHNTVKFVQHQLCVQTFPINVVCSPNHFFGRCGNDTGSLN